MDRRSKVGVSSAALMSLALLLGACHSRGGGAAETMTAHEGADAMADAEPKGAQEAEPAPPRSLALERAGAPAGRLTEVVADARGEVALTLDQQGQVALWPELRAEDGAELRLYSLPIFEPMSMSVAQGRATAEGGKRYFVAHIDTTNTGGFGEVEIDAEGQARYIERFQLPPSDPLFEVHALDGGERVLVLGIDHRVRLYDRNGALLSSLDEPGFAPWQLRMAGGVGRAPKLAVVLAQPLRVQAIALDGDTLKIVGEPRPFELDRGPNHNDLALSPDGETIAGLRRPKAKTRQWSVELIDLVSGERRLVAGRTTSLVRPRMHFVSASKLLLEHGDGRGSEVDLSLAELPPERTRPLDPPDLHPDSRFAERLSKRLDHPRVSLPGPKEESWEGRIEDDDFERMHASVVHGLRLALDRRRPDVIIADDLTRPGHDELGFPNIDLEQGALDAAGGQVAWASREELIVESLDGGASRVLPQGHGRPRALHFIDTDRLLLLAERSGGLRAKIVDAESGEVLEDRKLTVKWSVAAAAYRSTGPGAGELVYRDNDPAAPLRQLTIVGGALGETQILEGSAREPWLGMRDLGKEALRERIEALAGSAARAADDIESWSVDASGQLYFVRDGQTELLTVVRAGEYQDIPIARGQNRGLSLSPDGSRAAVVQGRRDGPFGSRQELLLAVLDVRSGEQLWTRELHVRRGSSASGVALRWSASGDKLATIAVGDGGVYDAQSGEIVVERETGYARLERVVPE